MRNISQSELLDNFREAMNASEISYNGEIIADGNLHRFYIEGDKHGSQNGWYVMHMYPVTCGVFGNWKTGLTQKWSIASGSNLTRYEIEKQRRHIKEAFKKQREVLDMCNINAAMKARDIFSASNAASKAHPYLLKKRVPIFTARQKGNLLILPICDFNDDLWSLQFISPDGSKKLLSGGKKRGMYIPVNGSLATSNTLLICEGFATGATLARFHPNACVIAAIDCGNLEPVSLGARMKFPKVHTFICADDDRCTKGNPGLTYAKLAVAASGASLMLPPWPAGAPDTLTDFNDLACWLEDNEEVMV